MKLCPICNETKPLDCFHINSKDKKTGRYRVCKQCRVEIDKKYYRNSEKPLRCQEYRRKLIRTRNELKSKACMYCGEDDICCLDFHHTDPSKKLACVSQLHGIPKMVAEAEKCEVICANCHKKLHAGRILAPLV